MSDIKSLEKIQLGEYPESEQLTESMLEKSISKLQIFLKGKLQFRRSQWVKVLASIETVGQLLKTMPPEALEVYSHSLRKSLRYSGLSQGNIIKAFALIREVSDRTMGMKHYPVQLMGGWVLMHGMLAEMQTGEGKTLTAVLPAATAAFAGIPVHVITSNEYLANRDAALMKPIYQALGLNVASIKDSMSPEERCAAYQADITYCTNSQVAFDYLRDRMKLADNHADTQKKFSTLFSTESSQSPLLLRGLCYCIVDEADCVLLDEARTPLVLARDAKNQDEEATYHKALEIAEELVLDKDFSVNESDRSIKLHHDGRLKIRSLANKLGGIWKGNRRSEYLIHLALCAQHSYIKNKDYLVRKGTVQIIDEYSGRVMADRTWERGLHQMVECKENCEITGIRETLARITYQRFFRRYVLMSGMSGTVKEISSELLDIYRLDVVVVPKHQACQRTKMDTKVYHTLDNKWSHIIDRIKDLNAQGRSVLVGTCSVADSEHISHMLDQVNISHQILNARQDIFEAEVISKAGQFKQVTVATNMAGRGTDIKLDDKVKLLGGLHVIITEYNDAMRIDRQLIGRCARQGEPGSYEAILSLDDPLMTLYYPASFLKYLHYIFRYKSVLPAWLGVLLQRKAQRSKERQHKRAQYDLLKYDDYMDRLLAFTGRKE